MKERLLILISVLISINTMAQIPNFGTCCGNQCLYGYSSMKYRVNAEKNGMTAWTTYSTLQYGVTDYMSIGVDLSTGDGIDNIGYIIRLGLETCQWFKIGAQFTPSFNINNRHKFSYMTYGLYMNGDITEDGNFFWVTDSWLEHDKNCQVSVEQWTYFGYTFDLPGKCNSITPIGGMIHSWKFDRNPDLSFGCYYTHKNINLYVWGNDIVTNNPRFVLAVEFKFSNK